ncbi:MAG TPA: hypothetical protein VJK54_03930 [Chthoniobacterales bacterium]|nr:hypothetical protein [Chthoniobacterales bacterium]
MEALAYIKLLENGIKELTTRCEELVKIVEKQDTEITGLKVKIVELSTAQ